MVQRPLDQLVDRDDPAMPQIAAWSRSAARPVEILPAADGAANLVALQVTTRSTLGAVAYETGGIRIDDGWLRVLGGGSAKLERSLASWNRIGGEPRLPGALLVADDAIGGFFAMRSTGELSYFAPDTCAWEDLELGYTDWLEWAMCGSLDELYAPLRWPGWRDEVRELDGDRAILIYPPLWTEGDSIAERSRKDVPVAEIWSLHTGEYAELLGADM